MDYKEKAEQKGLKFEVIPFEDFNQYYVEGPTEQVLAFMKESVSYAYSFSKTGEKTSGLIFF